MQEQDFETVWQQQIKPFLNANQESRKQSRWIASWAAMLVIGLFFLQFSVAAAFDFIWFFLFFGLIGLGLVIFSVWKIYTSLIIKGGGFHNDFKRRIISALTRLVDFDWEIHLNDEVSDKERQAARKRIFTASRSIFSRGQDIATEPGLLDNPFRTDGREVFQESGLYADYSSFSCHDKLTAYWHQVAVAAYEINVRRQVRRSNSSIFKGFIIKIEIDKEFSGKTYIQTEQDQEVVADEVSWLSFSADDDVKETDLEWVDFEQFLQVKSSDPTGAREILTPDFMEVLYEWWQNHQNPLRIAFKGRAVYVAYPTVVDLEPKIFGSIETEKPVAREILEFLVFVENLVKTIIGGQRLWFDKPLAPQPPENHKKNIE